MDYFSSLSIDLKRHIGLYLSFEELKKITSYIDEDNIFWKMKLNQDFGTDLKSVYKFMAYMVNHRLTIDDIIDYNYLPIYLKNQNWSEDIVDNIMNRHNWGMTSVLKGLINLRDCSGSTMIIYLATNSKTIPHADEYIQKLVANGGDVEIIDDDNFTALMCASRNTCYSKPSTIKVLIDGGADVNAQSICGWNPLSLFINNSISASSLEGLKILFDNGADINIQNLTEQLTPLMLACKVYPGDCSTACLSYLIERKEINLNVQCLQGWTALMYAVAYSRDPKPVELLLKAWEINLNIQNNDGDTALMLSLKFLKNDIRMKMLLKAGADVNIRNNQDQTALIIACMNLDEPRIKSLLKYKPNMNIEDYNKKTALMYLLDKEANISIIKKCIDAGADINTQGEGGYTPLMHVIEHHGIEVIASLLEYPKIKVNLKNDKGETAYDLARRKYGKKHPISRLLRSYIKK